MGLAPDNSYLYQQIKDLIFETANTFKGDINAALVTERLMMEHYDEIVANPRLQRYLVRYGAGQIAQSVLKQYRQAGDEEDEVPQLELFPEAEREWVKIIDRVRVYVPSVASLKLVLELTADEADEAGDHLFSHGEDTIRRGAALKRIAQMRRNGKH